MTWYKIVTFRQQTDPPSYYYGEIIGGSARATAAEAAELPGEPSRVNEVVRLRDDHRGAYVRTGDILERA